MYFLNVFEVAPSENGIDSRFTGHLGCLPRRIRREFSCGSWRVARNSPGTGTSGDHKRVEGVQRSVCAPISRRDCCEIF